MKRITVPPRKDAKIWQYGNSQARIKIAALNRMTQLGLPDSYRVA